MRLARRIAAWCALALAASVVAPAQPPGDASPAGVSEAAAAPLLPEELLATSRERFPLILESLAQARAAAGSALAAQGAFDLVFSSDGFSRVTGFWDGSVVNTDVRRNVGAFGATVFGGYRISDGDFPIYEDINFTNTGGEVKVGALFSLLRDRDIDAQRFGVADARLAADQADLDVLLTKVGVQQKALSAYWRWVAAGRQLRVYTNLLRIAEEREAGLIERVRRGALAEIAITENRQNITRRRILVAQADRDFVIAATALSFYLRDPLGGKVIPSADRLPPDGALRRLDPVTALAAPPMDEVLASRPELQQLEAAIARARNRIALGENDLKPQLDFSFEVSHDFGDVAEGGISRDSTDTIIGFEFSVPFERRAARGRLRRAEAEYEAARLRQRRIADRIEIELQTILAELGAALRLLALAGDDVEQSDAMTEAERRRFASGASDFFLVNVREETAADARIRELAAELNSRIAKTNYDAATVNLSALGLSADADF